MLEDFSDPRRAVERDPRSPGGRGFSGMQALARYIFSQSVQANAFDINGYVSRSSVFSDDCSRYVDAERAREDTDRTQKCNAWLGPNQIGITVPDPTADDAGGARSRARDFESAAEILTEALTTSKPGPGSGPGGGGPGAPTGPGGVPQPGLPGPPSIAPESLLDFLLAP